MKKSIFDRTVIGLMLALLASATLAIGVVGADPLSAPADSPYISPTFNGVNVMENANVFGTIKNPASGLGGGGCPEGFKCEVKLDPFGSPLVIADQVEIDYGLSVAKGASIGENLSVGTDPALINLNLIGKAYLGSDVAVLGKLYNHGDTNGGLLLLEDPEGIDIRSPIKNLAGVSGIDPVTIADSLKVGTGFNSTQLGATDGFNKITSSAEGLKPASETAPLIIKVVDSGTGVLRAWMGFDAWTIYSSANIIKIKPAGAGAGTDADPNKLVRIGGNDLADPYNLQITGTTDARGVIKNTSGVNGVNPVTIDDAVNIKDSVLTFNWGTLTGDVSKGLTGNVNITATKFDKTTVTSNPKGVALDGRLYAENITSLGELWAVGTVTALKSIFTLQHILALGNAYIGGDVWAKGTGTFNIVDTSVIQNTKTNIKNGTSDPLVLRDDVIIQPGLAGSNNAGDLTVAGKVTIQGDTNMKSALNVTGNISTDANLTVGGSDTDVNNLYIYGKLGYGFNNPTDVTKTITKGGTDTAKVSCLNQWQLMTHCGYKLDSQGILRVVDIWTTRSAIGVDECNVKAYNSSPDSSKTLTAKASCLSLRRSDLIVFFPIFHYIDWSILPMFELPDADITKLLTPTISYPNTFKQPIDLLQGQNLIDPLKLNPGNVDPVPDQLPMSQPFGP